MILRVRCVAPPVEQDIIGLDTTVSPSKAYGVVMGGGGSMVGDGDEA